MKNIEIVDGALNNRFEIYEVVDEVFDRLFKNGEDKIYLDDVDEDLQEDGQFWDQVYVKEVDRHEVQGIHWILHTHPRAKVSIVELTGD
jgi:hypothetical protein